nr:protein PTCD3 homolog, mitochondrial [Parasteatoda tepidariorum]
MAASRRFTNFTKQRHFTFLKSSVFYSTNVTTRPSEKTKVLTQQNDIVVPYKIERSPTDILKALNSTISKDHTAAHYKYEDDPYFIPASNVTKRSFALSKESGKKAARYFLEKYPELFKCNTSIPHIKAFDPPLTYTESDNVTETLLKDCILNFEVQNSIDIFNILKKKGIDVSKDVKQDLLDLLCFYNNIPPPPDDYYEERYFQRIDEATKQKWNANGMAEKLFDSMDKDGKAYSSMIAGLSKYGEVERALFLHDEMKSKGLIGTTQAYNSLISECHHLHEDSSSCWEMAMRLLSQMNADGVNPDLYTMNGLLRILSKGSRWRKSRQLSLNVIGEMKRLKIEPSLGTYYYLLIIYGSDADAGVLYEIMGDIQNKEHKIRHPSDVLFFATAMEVCWKSLADKDLAYRLHKLLEYKNNCKLLGNALAESHYFKCFFRLLSETEDIDIFMELYEKFIPNSYTPEPIVTLSVIEAVHFVGAYKYLPKLCSDVLLFEQTERTNILEALLEAAACTKNEENIQKPLIEMVWNIFDNLITRSKGRRLPFEWTGPMLSNILKTFMNGKDMEKSWPILQKLKDEETTIIGSPEKSALLDFCQMCLEFQDFKKMMVCVKYAENSYYPDFKDDLLNIIEESKLSENEKMDIKAALNSASFGSEETSSSSSSSSDDASSSDSSSDSSNEEENDNQSSKTE